MNLPKWTLDRLAELAASEIHSSPVPRDLIDIALAAAATQMCLYPNVSNAQAHACAALVIATLERALSTRAGPNV